MYFEEKIINGVLCWRGEPDAEWTPYTIEQLSNTCVDLKAATQVYSERMNKAIAILSGESQ